jgi:MerR family transcriptional regulator, light-induced transcriptional regulator
MMIQYFSTRELSELCAVGETTVKRWANMGLIKFHKTIGGHRKFKLDDVLDFINKNHVHLAPEAMERLNVQKKHSDSIDLNTEMLLVRGDVEALAAKLMESLLDFRKNEVEAILSKAIDRIESFAIIFDKMIAPTMYHIGELWCEKKISISEEHIMTNLLVEGILKTKVRFDNSSAASVPVSSSALTLLYSNTSPSPHERTAIVCTCPESELHEVPLLGVSMVCEAMGFRVHYVGASVPFGDLEKAAAEMKPDLLCMSITNARLDKSVYRRYNSFRKSLLKHHTRFLIGGQFLGELKSQPFQADFRASSCLQLEEYLQQNFDAEPRPLSKSWEIN